MSAGLQHTTQRLAGGHLDARVGTSIAERRDVIGELGRDIDYMADRLESQLATHKRLLRDVSHELRSPLARMQVALGLAHQKLGGNEYIQRIELEADRLEDLIAQLLTIARLENDGGDCVRSPVPAR